MNDIGIPLVPCKTLNDGSVRGSPNGTIGNFTNGTNCTIGRANGAIGTNGITIGTIGKTLIDNGIPLVPLGNPEHTRYWYTIGTIGKPRTHDDTMVQFRPYCQVWRLGPLDLTH